MQPRSRHIVALFLLFLLLFLGVVGFFYQYWFMHPYKGKKTIIILLYKSNSLDALVKELDKKKLHFRTDDQKIVHPFYRPEGV